MPKYKNIRIKKRGGGTRLQRVQVLASGKYKFVKNTRSSTKRKTTKNKTKRKRTVARRKKKTRRRTSKRIPLSVLAATTVSVFSAPAPGWGSVMSKVQSGQIDQAVQSFIASWTGLRLGGIGGQAQTGFNFAGVLNPFDMTEAPAAKTMMWTKIATKITRKIAGNPFTRIPFVKDYVSFS